MNDCKDDVPSPRNSKVSIPLRRRRQFVHPTCLLLAWLIGACDDGTQLETTGAPLPAARRGIEAGDPRNRTGATDSDGDTLDDAWELNFFGDLQRDGTGDFDADGFSDKEEHDLGLDPTVDDAYDDADGDRYPNIFEHAHGTDVHAASSVPAPDFRVNPDLGDDDASDSIHTTIAAAIAAARSSGTPHAIIGIDPGTYVGASNRTLTIEATDPELLLIGLGGAASTTINGDGSTQSQIMCRNRCAIASLTFERLRAKSGRSPLRIEGSTASGSRLIDLRVIGSSSSSTLYGVLRVAGATDVQLTGSTIYDSQSTRASSSTLYVSGGGSLHLTNTILWNPEIPRELRTASSGSASADHSLVRLDAVAGTNNIVTDDPRMRSDGRLLSGSPAIGAGVPSQSQFDMDLEPRTGPAPDIGVDHRYDSDADGLPDQWEIEMGGSITAFDGADGDADGDGFSNDEEYEHLTHPLDADSDGDGLSDGDERAAGTDVHNPDTDGDGLPDGLEVQNGMDPLANADAFADLDGDRYPNAFELLHGTDPQNPGSIPAPTHLVDPVAGANDPFDHIYSNLPDAVDAAAASSETHPIIGLVGGVHILERSAWVQSDGPQPLIIGLDGAHHTIVEGDSIARIQLSGRSVVASLTLRKFNATRGGVLEFDHVSASGSRVNDVIAHDNSVKKGVVYASKGAADLVICGSTFVDNRGSWKPASISLERSSTAELRSSILYNPRISQELRISGSITAHDSLVRNTSVAGSNNLSNVDPLLLPDGRLGLDSPVLGLGARCGSTFDMELEPRPTGSVDMGADQWVDVDADGLPDGWEVGLAGNLTSLNGRDEDADGDGIPNGQEFTRITHPLDPDTDDDGLVDGQELVNGSDPLDPDTDDDDIPDGPEVTAGLDPLHNDAFDDLDGDRFPNVFEFMAGSDMASAASQPAIDHMVDPELDSSRDDPNDNVHRNIETAVSAAYGTRPYAIVGLMPGVYTGSANTNLDFRGTQPILVLGLDGAATTVLDGQGVRGSFFVTRRTVFASMTIRGFNDRYTILLQGESTSRSKLVDLRIIDNRPNSEAHPAIVRVWGGTEVEIRGSTIVDNHGQGHSPAAVAAVEGAEITLTNTIVHNPGLELELRKSGDSTVQAHYSLVRGDAIPGTHNVSATDPGLDAEGRLMPGSPAIGRGGASGTIIDMDGETRSSPAPDIGVDQLVDVDADGIPDYWELQHASTLADFGADADFDGDALDDENEWLFRTDPRNPDTDGDWYSDGVEIALGQDPLVFDELAFDADFNHDGVSDALGIQVGMSPFESDHDGDGLSNALERQLGTNPFAADSDGDGIPDAADAFPLDAHASSLPDTPGDSQAPVVDLRLPIVAEPL